MDSRKMGLEGVNRIQLALVKMAMNLLVPERWAVS
jgi:hypothetical protein